MDSPSLHMICVLSGGNSGEFMIVSRNTPGGGEGWPHGMGRMFNGAGQPLGFDLLNINARISILKALVTLYARI